MECRIVTHGTEAYRDLVELRFRILREPLDLNFSDEELAAESRQVHLGGYESGAPVACAVLAPAEEEEIVQVRQVAVEESRRGSGLGRAMMAFTEQHAIEIGMKRIVCHSRFSAVPFYEALGYTAEGGTFEEVGLTHIKMAKMLRVEI